MGLTLVLANRYTIHTFHTKLPKKEVDMVGPKGKYAWTVKVGEKGQFVIPKEARDIFDIKPGDTLIVLADEKEGMAIPPKSTFERLFATIFGGKGDESGEGA
jgi:AbrB family looped-hinge helix DNA binding protein